jgi:uncharacterized membrane protein
MLFTPEDEKRIIAEIRAAELTTTGEIRVYVEDYCFRETPLLRAAEVFQLHKMSETQHRNGVLIYLAEKSRQFAIYGDEGVFKKEPETYWLTEKSGMREQFREGQFAEGVIKTIREVAKLLAQHFPDDGTRINELSDDILYG